MGSHALSLCHLAAGRIDAVCSLKPPRSVDFAAGQLLVRERGLAIDLFDGPAVPRAPLDLEARSRVVAAGTDELCARRSPTRSDPHRLLRLELRALARRRLLSAAAAGARSWLELYAERFDTVEVNATFYRLPTREAVARWVEQTPDGFLFAVKASRYLTHIKRLRDLGPGLERFSSGSSRWSRSPKLGPLLWQLPRDVPARRRAARRGARAASAPAGTLRVPPRELVRRRDVLRCCASTASRS